MFSIWIPKIAAFLAALLVSWAAKKGFTLETEGVTAFFIGTFTLVQGVANKYMNPGNVNAPELVDQAKVETRQVQQRRQAWKDRGSK